MTIKEKVVLLTAMRDSKQYIALTSLSETTADKYWRESMILDMAIKVLTDNSYAKELAEIYEENMNEIKRKE